MITISNSEVQLYKTCKRSWFIQYYLCRSPREHSVTGATNLGTKVHAALEGYYNPSMRLSPAEALTAFRHMYELDEQSNPEASEELWKEHELGALMLSGYFHWLKETGADQNLEVVAVEREIIVPMTPEVSLRGRLDMIVRDRHAGSLMFLDHKTCLPFLTVDYLDRDEQSKFYMMLQRLDPKAKDLWCDGGIFNMLKKSKQTAKATPPFYKRETVRHNADTLNSMYKRTYQVVNEIVDMRKELDEGVDFQQVAYPSPGKDCVWRCPAASGLCAIMDDGSDWQGYLDNEWVKIDPYARYTDFSYLDRLDQEGML